jgi:hypothetical protein
MANAERGEVDLVVGDKTYTLFLSTNALCELQNRTKKTYGQVIRDLRTLDMSDYRELVWAVLKKYHRKAFTTVEQVGELIDDAKPRAVMDALVQLFKLAQPPAEETETGGAVRPPEDDGPSDGTGANSIETADDSA